MSVWMSLRQLLPVKTAKGPTSRAVAELVTKAADRAKAAAQARGEEWPDTAGWHAGVRAWVWGRLGGNSLAWATHCESLLTGTGQLPEPTEEKQGKDKAGTGGNDGDVDGKGKVVRNAVRSKVKRFEGVLELRAGDQRW